MTVVQVHEHGAVAPHFPRPRGEVPMYELVLTTLPSAVTCARLLMTYAAQRWRLRPCCERELGCAAEVLVRHALGHRGNAAPRTSSCGRPVDLFVVRLHLTARAVVLEVWDCATDTPPPPATAPTPGGCDFPGAGLRVMWRAIQLDTADTPRDAQWAADMPRRHRLPGPARASLAMRDPDLLIRVLNGLRKLGVAEE